MCKPRGYKVILIFFCVVTLSMFSAAKVMAEPVEMKISHSVLQSFIDAAFPITVKQDVDLMGAAKIPLTINLYNPGRLVIFKPMGPDPSFMKLSMEYDISSNSIVVSPSKGKLGGDFTVILSHDQESLHLSFGEMNLQVTPFLRISLTSLLKPIKVPLFRGFPVKVQEREIYGRFRNIRIDVEGSDLIIKSDFFFDKTLQTKT